jgi:hypothetical protein
MKKTIFLLNIDNFAPEVTRLTYPFICCYADKIGADIYVIKERKFLEMPITYEKLQIYDLAKEIKSDWNIYIDSDALIHPQFLDITSHLQKDMVCCYDKDEADGRWKMDEIFLRDGRHIGWGNWLTIASDWCLDLWHPLDITLAQALDNIYPTPSEIKAGVTREHLIDDYTISRNVARFGLKFKTVKEIYNEPGLETCFIQHQYLLSVEEQVSSYENKIIKWNCAYVLEKYKNCIANKK